MVYGFDQIGSRSNALIKTVKNLPISRLLDEIVPILWNDENDDAVLEYIRNNHFLFVNAGEPLGNPLEALPYMGPNWYWTENAEAIFNHGLSKAGNVSRQSFKFALTASTTTSGKHLGDS